MHFGYGDTLRAYDEESGCAEAAEVATSASDQAAATIVEDVQMAEVDVEEAQSRGSAAGVEGPSGYECVSEGGNGKIGVCIECYASNRREWLHL